MLIILFHIHCSQTMPSRTSDFRLLSFTTLLFNRLMVHLHWRRRTWVGTRIWIPNQMATPHLCYENMFTLHRLRPLLPISVQDRNPRPSRYLNPSLAMYQHYSQSRQLLSYRPFPKKLLAGMTARDCSPIDSFRDGMVEQCNSTSQIMERPGTVRPAALWIAL